MSIWLLVIVLLAGAVGSVLRFGLSRRWPAVQGKVPRGILWANLIGSAIGGVIAGISGVGLLGGGVGHALFAGFCGGLTTFSTWAVDTVLAARERQMRVAVINVTVTILASILLFLFLFFITALTLNSVME